MSERAFAMIDGNEAAAHVARQRGPFTGLADRALALRPFGARWSVRVGGSIPRYTGTLGPVANPEQCIPSRLGPAVKGR